MLRPLEIVLLPSSRNLFPYMKAVGLGGCSEFHVVIIVAVAYVLNVMFQIIEVAHFM